MKTLPKHKKLNHELDELSCLVNKKALKELKKLLNEAIDEAYTAGEKRGLTESADLADKLIDQRLKTEELLNS